MATDGFEKSRETNLQGCGLRFPTYVQSNSLYVCVCVWVHIATYFSKTENDKLDIPRWGAPQAAFCFPSYCISCVELSMTRFFIWIFFFSATPECFLSSLNSTCVMRMQAPVGAYWQTWHLISFQEHRFMNWSISVLSIDMISIATWSMAYLYLVPLLTSRQFVSSHI